MTDDICRLPPTARSLPIALMRAREGVMAPIREMLAASGLTEQQWRVLRVLDEAGPLDASALAARSCLLLPSLTRIAQGMAAKSLIWIVKDPLDKRRSQIRITTAGRALIAENLGQATVIAERYRMKLGAEDHDRLLDLLEALSEV